MSAGGFSVEAWEVLDGLDDDEELDIAVRIVKVFNSFGTCNK